VQEPHVYTPERVEARYGIRPDQVPDFIGLKGDTSDNIPGVPGIGDKTAGQLISQYGSVEEVIEHAEELSPARRKNILEHADVARESKELATMRRDLDIDLDPSQLVLAPPDRSQLREMFRRFEFRNLLNRIDLLDEAVPAAERPKVVGTHGPVAGGNRRRRGDGYSVVDDQAAAAGDDGVVIGAPRRASEARVVAHDAKSLRVEPWRTRCSPRS
jgi:DNA polymerase-1